MGKGRGKPGPRVLSPIPGMERNSSCEGRTGAAAAGQNLFDPMTRYLRWDGEEEFGEKAALRVLGQENLTKVQLAQGTPTALSSYGRSAASESQQPADVSPVHSSRGAENEDFEEAKGNVDHHINNISGGDSWQSVGQQHPRRADDTTHSDPGRQPAKFTQGARESNRGTGKGKKQHNRFRKPSQWSEADGFPNRNCYYGFWNLSANNEPQSLGLPGMRECIRQVRCNRDMELIKQPWADTRSQTSNEMSFDGAGIQQYAQQKASRKPPRKSAAIESFERMKRMGMVPAA